jgi:hypothetical protein
MYFWFSREPRARQAHCGQFTGDPAPVVKRLLPFHLARLVQVAVLRTRHLVAQVLVEPLGDEGANLIPERLVFLV